MPEKTRFAKAGGFGRPQTWDFSIWYIRLGWLTHGGASQRQERAHMKHPHSESPVNPLPPVVVALFLVMAGVELAFNLGGQRG